MCPDDRQGLGTVRDEMIKASSSTHSHEYKVTIGTTTCLLTVVMFGVNTFVMKIKNNLDSKLRE